MHRLLNLPLRQRRVGWTEMESIRVWAPGAEPYCQFSSLLRPEIVVLFSFSDGMENQAEYFYYLSLSRFFLSSFSENRQSRAFFLERERKVTKNRQCAWKNGRVGILWLYVFIRRSLFFFRKCNFYLRRINLSNLGIMRVAASFVSGDPLSLLLSSGCRMLGISYIPYF